MSGCCFNQVESGPRTDLQLVERASRTHGLHYGVRGKSVRNNCFPTPAAKLEYFSLPVSHTPTLTHTHTHTQKDDGFQLVCFGEEENLSQV